MLLVGIIAIILLIVLVSIVFLINDAKYSGNKESGIQLPYTRKEYLTVPERKFYDALLEMMPEGYVLFPQVLVSSLVKVNAGKKLFWTWQNKINRKTIDFVIFNTQSLQPLIAIEYDGKTHQREDRKERDSFVQEVLTGVGITSMHFRHNYSDMEELRTIILEKLSNNA